MSYIRLNAQWICLYGEVKGESTGLKPQQRRYVELDDAPERVWQVHRRMKPHYDHLYQHRIQAN